MAALHVSGAPDRAESASQSGPLSSGGSRFVALWLAVFGLLCFGAGQSWAADDATEEAAGSVQGESDAGEATQSLEAYTGEGLEPELFGEEEIEDFSGIETIEITGKAGQAVGIDTAESITAFDSDDLDALGVSDISDISRVTPNLEIRTAGATTANFFIRGVGLADFSANAASAVAVYQDGVPLNSPAIQLGQLFDVEGVEVLRGPQGAGSGRNASAGAIKIKSRKPTGVFAADMKTTTGVYQSNDARSALIQTYEGAIEMPLMEDLLSTRLAFRVQANDPYQYNGCGNLPAINLDANGRFVDELNPGRPRFSAGQREETLVEDGISLCGNTDLDPESTEISALPVFNPNGPPFFTFPRLRIPGDYDDTPAGLPSAVGDKGNWSVRGQLRYQPMTSQVDMDWLLNVHGGRVKQQSTLGQAIGTAEFPKSEDGEEIGRFGYGGRVAKDLYTDPDVKEELLSLHQGFLAAGYPQTCPGGDLNSCANAQSLATETLGRNLARERPLDIRPYRGDYNRVGLTELDTWGSSLNGVLMFDSVEITSITGYEGYDRRRETDQDFTPLRLFESIVTDSAWQITQEVQANGESDDGTFRWELGAFYLKEDLVLENIQFIDSEFLPVTRWLRSFEQKTDAASANFGFAWEFVEGLKLEAGVRYNWEQKKFDFEIDRNVPGDPRFSYREKSWSEPTGNISLTYKLDDSKAVYWKYGHGFKAGHFNSINANDPPAKPETIDAVEAGFRGIFLDGMLSMDGAIFYYKYEDYQVFLFDDQANSPPSLVIKNAKSTEQYGVELDVYAEPLRDVLPEDWWGPQVTGRFSWLRSRFLDFTNRRTIAAVGSGGVLVEIVDYSGNSLPNSPNFKFSGTVEWPMDFGSYGSVVPRYDFAWTDDLFFDPSDGVGVSRTGPLPELALGQPAYMVHNLRLTYRNPESTVEVAFWVRNLTDQRYRSYAFDASTFSNIILNFVGEPRSMGVDLALRF